MTENKAYASLSSGLLARKGAAKPAMRPQGFGTIGAPSLEDLGWNDMGYPPEELPEPAERVPSSIAALTPSPRLSREAEAEEEEVSEPHVVEQQRAIAESFGEDEEEEAPAAPIPAPEPAAILPLPQRPAAAAARRKSAFTLRLDPERHFRLRLGCAVTGRSAQQIVTEALDGWLEALPEIDALAERMPLGAQRS